MSDEQFNFLQRIGAKRAEHEAISNKSARSTHHYFPDQEIIAALAKKSPSNVLFGKLRPRLKTTYMPRHTARYCLINMTYKNINQSNTKNA